MVALAVAAVILIGSGAGQSERGGGAEDPAPQSPQQSTAEEAGQPTSEGAPEDEQGASEGGNQASGPSEEGGKLGSPALGDEGAPVVLVEYSDYQ